MRADVNCDAEGCKRAVLFGRVFCHDHWKMLSETLKTTIADAYQWGQCFGIHPELSTPVRASKAFIVAVHAAIEFIELEEKKQQKQRHGQRK